jgi:hypothetical protein
MLSIVSGVVAIGASGASLWYFKPRHGVVHPLVQKPFVETFLSIAIMGVFAVGIALILDGFF